MTDAEQYAKKKLELANSINALGEAQRELILIDREIEKLDEEIRDLEALRNKIIAFRVIAAIIAGAVIFYLLS